LDLFRELLLLLLHLWKLSPEALISLLFELITLSLDLVNFRLCFLLKLLNTSQRLLIALQFHVFGLESGIDVLEAHLKLFVGFLALLSFLSVAFDCMIAFRLLQVDKSSDLLVFPLKLLDLLAVFVDLLSPSFLLRGPVFGRFPLLSPSILLLILEFLLEEAPLCLSRLLDFLGQAKDLLLQLDDHAILLGFQVADLGNILLRDLRRSLAHLHPILVHLLKLALEELYLTRQILYLVLVGAHLLALRLLHVGQLLILKI